MSIVDELFIYNADLRRNVVGGKTTDGVEVLGSGPRFQRHKSDAVCRMWMRGSTVHRSTRGSLIDGHAATLGVVARLGSRCVDLIVGGFFTVILAVMTAHVGPCTTVVLGT